MDLIIVIGIAVAIILIVILQTYNSIIKKKKIVDRESATIDVYLTQRFDLIPNLVECVKTYTKHESKIFEEIAKMRTEYMNTRDLKKGEILNNECNRLVATIENYPELKASEQFLLLQQKLSKIESQLQAARRLYNGAVTTYNTAITVVSNNIIAKIFHFKEAKLFELENPEEKDNTKIEL